jgi:hypothetical protein
MARFVSGHFASVLPFMLLGVLCLMPLPGSAQSHFDDCAARTASNATVILPTGSVFIEDRSVDYGDEIAVYTPEGACAGAVTWTGVNTALTVWGYDSLSAAAGTAGLRSGAPLLFRIWDASAEVEMGGRGAFALDLATGPPYLTEEPRYAADAIYRVHSLTVRPGPAASNE